MSTPRRELREWLERHEHECASAVETWMTRSLPVASAVLEAVWADPAWSDALRYALVCPFHADSGPRRERTAFLAQASPERGLGLITLDGETSWLQPAAVEIVHPVLVPDLEEFRDFATELGLEQRLNQLHRETWPAPSADGARAVDAFAFGRFPQLLQAINRARSFGYSVRGGYAVCRIPEGEKLIEARYWIGSDDPTSPTITGALEWVGPEGEALALTQLGRVTYSEGMRMAARIYAGRGPDESDA